MATSFSIAGTATTRAALAGSAVQAEVTFNGRNASQATAGAPLRIHPSQDLITHVSVTNRGQTDVLVRKVRVEGRVLGLTFFSFTTRLDLTVPPGQTVERQFAIDVSDLGRQAVGLIRGRVRLLDAKNRPITSASVVWDVRGGWGSIYGVFAILLAAITIVLLAAGLIRLRRGELSSNRWWRGARFALPGLMLGLTIVFLSSALRWFVPTAAESLLTLVGTTAGGFAFGALTGSDRHVGREQEIDLRDSSRLGAEAAADVAGGAAPSTPPQRPVGTG